MRTVTVLVAALSLILAPTSYSQSPRQRAAVPQSNISSIFFAELYPVEVRPGGTRQFALYEYFGAGPFNYRPARGVNVRWTVDPPLGVEGIDQTGLLTISASASPGMTV